MTRLLAPLSLLPQSLEHGGRTWRNAARTSSYPNPSVWMFPDKHVDMAITLHLGRSQTIVRKRWTPHLKLRHYGLGNKLGGPLADRYGVQRLRQTLATLTQGLSFQLEGLATLGTLGTQE